jgi:hypothetical protein
MRLGLCALNLAAGALAIGGCSDNGMSSSAADMAVPTVDMASGMDQGAPLFDLAGPLHDLTGDPVIRVSGGFAQPFGVVFDSTSNAWYVSNIAGDLNNYQNLKDGKGWITKISADYKTVDHTFYTTGLNAPAGMRVSKGTLFVPDVDQLVAITIANRTGVRSATVAPASPFLPYVVMTDVDVEPVTGTAYATESAGSRILKFTNPTTAGGTPSAITANGVSFPTTILIDGVNFVVGTTGSPLVSGSTGNLYTMTLTGQNVNKLGTLAANYQGIEKDTDYVVGTTRAHTVARINAMSGASSVFRDFAMEGVVSVGDIGWDPTSRTLGVADVGTNAVYFIKM